MGKGNDRLAGYACVVLAVAAGVLLAGCTSFMGQQDKRAAAQLLPTMGSQVRGELLRFVPDAAGAFNRAWVGPHPHDRIA